MKSFAAVAGVTALLVGSGAAPTAETVRSETLAGSAQCFVTVRADVARVAR
jgi:hypothetical protein